MHTHTHTPPHHTHTTTSHTHTHTLITHTHHHITHTHTHTYTHTHSSHTHTHIHTYTQPLNPDPNRAIKYLHLLRRPRGSQASRATGGVGHLRPSAVYLRSLAEVGAHHCSQVRENISGTLQHEIRLAVHSTC